MKKIGISLITAFALGFASPQSLANISDLKESIVLLMERQDSIVEKIEDVLKKQEGVMKEVETLSKKIEEQEKKAKDREEDLNKKLKENKDKLTENAEENLRRFEEVGKDIEILNSAIQEQGRIEEEGMKQSITANEINLIVRGEIKNEIVKLQNDLKNLQKKLDEKIKANENKKKPTDKTKKEDKSIEERLEKIENDNKEILQGLISRKGENILISNEEIKNGLDWLEYKTELLAKELKKCCSKKGGEEVIFDFELK